jgi:sulfatase modifying factor 1
MKKIQKAKTTTLITLLTSMLLVSFQPVPHRDETMVYINGGTLTTTDPVTEKYIEIKLKPYLLDKKLVTVSDFETFVKETHYLTEAEKFGNAGVFNDRLQQWELVDGADFRYPFGRNKPKAEGNHPVTQVSWNDAAAYAQWIGKRLPTQWEWEHAAKNGEQTRQRYTWGEDLVIAGKYKANTWQGTFPSYNSGEDGYIYTSPVGVFGANKIGLTDMGGNVWQWCQDSIEPAGRDAEIDPATRRVIRGGSFLCDPMVCHGFRIAGRAASTPESSMLHIGFRCAKDAQ